MGKTKISLLTQSVFLAFAICTAAPGFAQQASAPTISAPVPSQDTKVDSSKAVEKDGVYEVGGPVLPPKLIRGPGPDMNTRSLFQRAKQGFSIISFVVDTDGRAKDLRIEQETGPEFLLATIGALGECSFQSGTLNGKPVPVRVRAKFEILEPQQVVFDYLPDAPTGSRLEPTAQALKPEPFPSADAKSKTVEKGGIYEVGGAVIPPRLIKGDPPDAPYDAVIRKKHGTCILSLVVDSAGNPQHVHIKKKVWPSLDRSAVEAVEKYRFQPAILDGKPVPVQIEMEIEFHSY